MLPNKWHVVSLAVDTTVGTILIYIDGKLASTLLSPDIAVPDGNFSVFQQVCLFGSKDVSETLGGNIKSFYFEDRAFGPAVRSPAFLYGQLRTGLMNPPIGRARALRYPAARELLGVRGMLILLLRNGPSPETNPFPAQQCTFLNPSSSIECSVCGQINPVKAASRAWICAVHSLSFPLRRTFLRADHCSSRRCARSPTREAMCAPYVKLLDLKGPTITFCGSSLLLLLLLLVITKAYLSRPLHRCSCLNVVY